MNTFELVKAAQAYTDLGWAVQDQFQKILDGMPVAEMNSTAVAMILDWLREHGSAADGADEIIDDIVRQQQSPKPDDEAVS